MTTMAAALAAALAAPLPAASTWGLVDALGGRREGTSTLAKLRAGLSPTAPLPAVGSPAYVRYRTARRSIERYLEFERPTPVPAGHKEKQKRRPPAAWIEAQRGRVRALATRRNVLALRRRGARARIYATVVVSADRRDRELPAGGPGQFLARGPVEQFTDPFLAGDFDAAGAAFEVAFVAAYGDGIDFEFEDVERVKVWPDGTEEPR